MQDVVRPFVRNPQALFRIMREHRAIISGSAALKFFLPEERWEVGDLDIYVPDSEFDAFQSRVLGDPGVHLAQICRKSICAKTPRRYIRHMPYLASA